jgi:hypothetical protein
MNNDVHYTLMNEIVLKDPYIMAFYEKYPYIDCTQLNKSMIIFLEQVLERNETKQDTSIIEKMFHKLMSIENYLQNDDPQSKSVSTMLKQELNHTKSSTLDAITAATRELLHQNKNDALQHTLQPLLETVSTTIDNKFQILHSNIVQPLCNSINETETRMNSRLETIQQVSNTNNTLCDGLNREMMEYLTRIKNSSFKGQYGENKLKLIMSAMYPQSVMDDSGMKQTSHTKKSGDFILHRGPNIPKILIENKEYDSKKVPDDEVTKFIRDVEEQDCHGIMLSQHNDISSKPNYHIEMNKSHILLYINQVNYDSYKIQLGINIVDFLHNKLLPLLQKGNSKSELHEIHTELLDKVNDEYKKFISSKENVYTFITDNNKKLMQLIDDIEMPNLDAMLSQFYATAHETQSVCKYCNKVFRGRQPKKALARHEPSCAKKHNKGIQPDD